MEPVAPANSPRRRPSRRRKVVAALVVVGLVTSGILVFEVYAPFDSKGVIAFEESGLPSGTNWSVYLDTPGGREAFQYATTGSGLADSNVILFLEPRGQYSYSVQTSLLGTGYAPSPSSGVVQAGGFTAYIPVHFGLVTQISQVLLPGTPVEGVCDSNATWSESGCTPGQYVWDLYPAVAPSVTYDSVLFSVVTSLGGNYTVPGGPGGFSLLISPGSLQSEISSTAMGGHLWMSTSWTTYNASVFGWTSIRGIVTIRIDVGDVDTEGMGLRFIVRGVGEFQGSTPPVVLE